MRQLLSIHGGDSYRSQADFYAALAVMPIWSGLPTDEPVVSWKRSLATDLGSDWEVYQPTMPNKQNADYQAWKIWFERFTPYLSDGAVLMGHSLGGMFLAKYLSEEPLAIRPGAVFLLAAPEGEYPPQRDGNDCASFCFAAEAAKALTTHGAPVEVWHDTTDPVVPVAAAAWYQAHVPGVQVRLFTGKGHFLGDSFPELLAALRAVGE